jgi:MFS family permease
MVGGLPITLIGLGLTSATLVSLPVSPITGTLTNRIGTLKTLTLSLLLQGLGFIGYLFVHSFPILFIMALLVTGGTRMFWVAFPTFIADLSAKGQRDSWYGLMASAQNAGIALAGLLAGLIVTIGGNLGYHVLIAANAASFVIAALLLIGLHDTRHQTMHSPSSNATGYRALLQDRTYIGVLLCSIVFILCAIVIIDILPIYLVETLHLSVWTVGASFTISTVLLVILQPLAVALTRPYRRTRIVMLAGLIWFASAMLYALALAIPFWLLIPFVFLVIAFYSCGELFYTPTINAFVAEFGSQHQRSRYIAAYQLVAWGGGSAIAPAFFTQLLSLGPLYLWGTVAGMALVATFAFIWLERHMPEQAVYKSETLLEKTHE